MITLRVPTDDPGRADAVMSVLDDLAVAYRVEPDAEQLAIVDGGQRIAAAELPGYLDDLRSFVADWHRFQSDACYVEDDGSIC